MYRNLCIFSLNVTVLFEMTVIYDSLSSLVLNYDKNYINIFTGEDGSFVQPWLSLSVSLIITATYISKSKSHLRLYHITCLFGFLVPWIFTSKCKL